MAGRDGDRVCRLRRLSGFKDLPTIPADEIVHLNDLTPAQAKRLKTMTTAELKALAKMQAKRRARS